MKADKYVSTHLVLVFYKWYDTIIGEIKYHSSNNIVYSCKYHIVFCPKYRRKVLVNGVDTRLKELIKEALINIE